jgi:hypothetical protein
MIEKNIILTNVVYLFGQKRSDMGLDWSILAVVLVLQRILPKLDELREIFFKNPNFGILYCKMLLVWKLQKFLKKRKLFYYLKWQRFFSRHTFIL